MGYVAPPDGDGKLRSSHTRTYKRLHVPTNKEWEMLFTENGPALSELDFLRTLDSWNRLGGGVWVYYR